MGTEELPGIQQREKQILHQGRNNLGHLDGLGGEQDLWVQRGPSNPGVILSLGQDKEGSVSETGAK